MVRKVIITLLSAAILIGGFVGSKKIADSKKSPEKKVVKTVTTVFSTNVQNRSIQVVLPVTGSLKAKNRVNLFSEVQGVMLPDNGKFKTGTAFDAGQSLVLIKADDFKASLMSQRSNLQNLVTAALADLRLDYPSSFDQWNSYLSNFDVNKSLPVLPEPASDKERMFITGRNIYTTYYNIKNAEIVLEKYNLTAPFNGILTNALVTPGTVIRPGQKLGEFIDPSVYELEAPISSSMIDYLKVGQEVQVQATDNSGRTWGGTVTRVNRLIDPKSQSISAFIQVSGTGLEEGMFLEASISAAKLEDAFEIPRSVVFDQDQIFLAVDTVLVQKTIVPIHFNEKTVIVRGLENDSQVLTKMPPGAYQGMKISIFKED
jgi:multidrug efflux pump subunit AcrA (membrane-fusion protein)